MRVSIFFTAFIPVTKLCGMNLGKHFDAHSCSGFLRLIILWEHQAMKCCYHHPDCTVHTVGLCRSKWIRPAFNALHSHSNLSIVLPRVFLIGRHMHTQLLYPCRSLKCCRSRWLCPSLSIRSLDIVFCFTKHIYHYCFNLVLRAHQHYGGLDTNTSMLGPSCPRPTPTSLSTQYSSSLLWEFMLFALSVSESLVHWMICRTPSCQIVQRHGLFNRWTIWNHITHMPRSSFLYLIVVFYMIVKAWLVMPGSNRSWGDFTNKLSSQKLMHNIVQPSTANIASASCQELLRLSSSAR